MRLISSAARPVIGWRIDEVGKKRRIEPTGCRPHRGFQELVKCSNIVLRPQAHGRITREVRERSLEAVVPLADAQFGVYRQPACNEHRLSRQPTR